MKQKKENQMVESDKKKEKREKFNSDTYIKNVLLNQELIKRMWDLQLYEHEITIVETQSRTQALRAFLEKKDFSSFNRYLDKYLDDFYDGNDSRFLRNSYIESLILVFWDFYKDSINNEFNQFIRNVGQKEEKRRITGEVHGLIHRLKKLNEIESDLKFSEGEISESLQTRIELFCDDIKAKSIELSHENSLLVKRLMMETLILIQNPKIKNRDKLLDTLFIWNPEFVMNQSEKIYYSDTQGLEDLSNGELKINRSTGEVRLFLDGEESVSMSTGISEILELTDIHKLKESIGSLMSTDSEEYSLEIYQKLKDIFIKASKDGEYDKVFSTMQLAEELGFELKIEEIDFSKFEGDYVKLAKALKGGAGPFVINILNQLNLEDAINTCKLLWGESPKELINNLSKVKLFKGYKNKQLKLAEEIFHIADFNLEIVEDCLEKFDTLKDFETQKKLFYSTVDSLDTEERLDFFAYFNALKLDVKSNVKALIGLFAYDVKRAFDYIIDPSIMGDVFNDPLVQKKILNSIDSRWDMNSTLDKIQKYRGVDYVETKLNQIDHEIYMLNGDWTDNPNNKDILEELEQLNQDKIHFQEERERMKERDQDLLKEILEKQADYAHMLRGKRLKVFDDLGMNYVLERNFLKGNYYEATSMIEDVHWRIQDFAEYFLKIDKKDIHPDEMETYKYLKQILKFKNIVPDQEVHEYYEKFSYQRGLFFELMGKGPTVFKPLIERIDEIFHDSIEYDQIGSDDLTVIRQFMRSNFLGFSGEIYNESKNVESYADFQKVIGKMEVISRFEEMFVDNEMKVDASEMAAIRHFMESSYLDIDQYIIDESADIESQTDYKYLVNKIERWSEDTKLEMIADVLEILQHGEMNWGTKEISIINQFMKSSFLDIDKELVKEWAKAKASSSYKEVVVEIIKWCKEKEEELEGYEDKDDEERYELSKKDIKSQMKQLKRFKTQLNSRLERQRQVLIDEWKKKRDIIGKCDDLSIEKRDDPYYASLVWDFYRPAGDSISSIGDVKDVLEYFEIIEKAAFTKFLFEELLKEVSFDEEVSVDNARKKEIMTEIDDKFMNANKYSSIKDIIDSEFDALLVRWNFHDFDGNEVKKDYYDSGEYQEDLLKILVKDSRKFSKEDKEKYLKMLEEGKGMSLQELHVNNKWNFEHQGKPVLVGDIKVSKLEGGKSDFDPVMYKRMSEMIDSFDYKESHTEGGYEFKENMSVISKEEFLEITLNIVRKGKFDKSQYGKLYRYLLFNESSLKGGHNVKRKILNLKSEHKEIQKIHKDLFENGGEVDSQYLSKMYELIPNMIELCQEFSKQIMGNIDELIVSDSKDKKSHLNLNYLYETYVKRNYFPNAESLLDQNIRKGVIDLNQIFKEYKEKKDFPPGEKEALKVVKEILRCLRSDFSKSFDSDSQMFSKQLSGIVTEKGDSLKTLIPYVSKSAETFLSRASVDLCTEDNYWSFKNKDFLQMVFVDPDQNKVVGNVQLHIFERDGRKCVLARLNPGGGFLAKVDNDALAEKMLGLVWEFARNNKDENGNPLEVYLPHQGKITPDMIDPSEDFEKYEDYVETWHGLTNRHAFEPHLKKYYSGKMITDTTIPVTEDDDVPYIYRAKEVHL